MQASNVTMKEKSSKKNKVKTVRINTRKERQNKRDSKRM